MAATSDVVPSPGPSDAAPGDGGASDIQSSDVVPGDIESSDVVPVRVTKRREQTRQRLIDVAYDVFAERGIRDTPVALICERAGYTRGAFYSNFDSKEDLFLAIYEAEFRKRRERLRTVGEEFRGSLDSIDDESLQAIVSQVLTLFAEPFLADQTWYVLTIEFRAQALRNLEVRARAEQMQHAYHESFGQLITELLAESNFELAADATDAMVILDALYETAVARSLHEDTTDPASNRFLTELLPTVILSLFRPRSR